MKGSLARDSAKGDDSDTLRATLLDHFNKHETMELINSMKTQ